MNRQTRYQANLVMNTKARFVLILTLVILAGTALWVTLIQAAPGNAPMTPDGSPTVVSYQGQVTLDGSPYEGKGYFKFAVVDAAGATTYWSNDGSSDDGREPEIRRVLASRKRPVQRPARRRLPGKMVPLEVDVFEDTECYLRVWFSSDGETFVQLSPDRRIAAVPYALQAQEALLQRMPIWWMASTPAPSPTPLTATSLPTSLRRGRGAVRTPTPWMACTLTN